MDSERWDRVRAVFSAALDQPADEIGPLLDGICTDDMALRTEVEELLSHLGAAGGFLDGMDRQRPGRPATGDLLAGRYRVLGHVGSGGMGDVFEVEDGELCEIVALKLLRPGNGASPEHLRREVRNARRIANPHVCRPYDIGRATIGGCEVAFMTMERVRGTTLSRLLEGRGGFDPALALAMAEQLCDAVAAAHRQGIVHGDLKAENVVYDDLAQRLVVLDFGLSRRDVTIERPPGTLSRAFGGTPAYLAPERYEGSSATFASDIYSVGMILHEIVAGDHPPGGRDANGRRLVSPSLPGSWAEAVVACVALNPFDRPSAAAVMDIVRPSEPIPPIAARLRTAPTPWARCTAATLLAIGAAVLVAHRPSTAPIRNADPTAMARVGPEELLRSAASYVDRQTPASVEYAIGAIRQALSRPPAPDPPTRGRAQAMLAVALARDYELTKRKEQLVQAGDALAAVDASARGTAGAELALGILQRDEGRVGAALSTFRRLVGRHAADGEAWRQLARTLAQAGDVLGAEAAYRDGLAHAPALWSLYSDYGWFLSTHARYQDAEVAMSSAHDLAPDQPAALANLGGLYLATGRTADAELLLARALAFERSPAVLANLGTARFAEGDFKGAARLYHEACDLRPADERLWGNLGDALARSEHPSEAATAYGRAASLAKGALNIDPSDPKLLGNLAFYSAKQGRSDAAREALSRAARAEGRGPDELVQSAITNELTGERSAALQDLRSALGMGIPFPTIEGSYELTSLRRDPAYKQLSAEWRTERH